jgi:hypothetical protein
MNHNLDFEVTGTTPDGVIIQRQKAERLGKHLRGTRFQRIGKPIPLAVLCYRRPTLVATWRVKDARGVWQEYSLYGLKADGTETSSFFLVEDDRAVEVEALAEIIGAMFQSRIEVVL